VGGAPKSRGQRLIVGSKVGGIRKRGEKDYGVAPYDTFIRFGEDGELMKGLLEEMYVGGGEVKSGGVGMYRKRQ